MRVIHDHIQRVRQEAAEPWQVDHDDAMTCLRIEELVEVMLGIWQALESFLKRHPAARDDCARDREVIVMLRSAEQAFGAIRNRAALLAGKGYSIGRLAELEQAQKTVRGMLLLPLGRMIARQDSEGRSPEHFRDVLLERVEWSDGRPLVTEASTLDLPYPFEPKTFQ